MSYRRGRAGRLKVPGAASSGGPRAPAWVLHPTADTPPFFLQNIVVKPCNKTICVMSLHVTRQENDRIRVVVLSRFVSRAICSYRFRVLPVDTGFIGSDGFVAWELGVLTFRLVTSCSPIILRPAPPGITAGHKGVICDRMQVVWQLTRMIQPQRSQRFETVIFNAAPHNHPRLCRD